MTIREYIASSKQLGVSWKVFLGLILISFIATLLESLGLVMIIPVYEYITHGGKVGNGGYWQYLDQISTYLGLKITLPLLLSIAFAFIMIRQVMIFIRQVISAHAREKASLYVRQTMFEKFLFSSFTQQKGTFKGELINDMTQELSRYSLSLWGFVALSNGIILGLVYSMILFASSWQMTLISCAVLSIAFLPIRKIYQKTREASGHLTDASSVFGKFLVERLHVARLIRLAGIEKPEINRIQKITEQQKKTTMRVQVLSALSSVIIEPILVGLAFIILWLAVGRFHVPLVTLGFFLAVILRLLPVSQEIIKGWQTVLSSAGSVKSLTEKMHILDNAREDNGGNLAFQKIQKGISFKNVHFAYDDKPILKGLNFTISAGEWSIILGPSGAGKSTLIDLLPRLQDTTQGDILFDDVSIQSFSRQSLRQGIAYVPQQAQIFDASPKEHILLGNINATMDEIISAAKTAGAYDFIMDLPNGYDTPLGEGGNRLSGGQRQRLDLARAVVRNAPLLILDEPTSHLDMENELAFLNALKRIRDQGTTIIMVTHRIESTVNADHIIVLNQGEIEAEGNYNVALKNSKWLQNLELKHVG